MALEAHRAHTHDQVLIDKFFLDKFNFVVCMTQIGTFSKPSRLFQKRVWPAFKQDSLSRKTWSCVRGLMVSKGRIWHWRGWLYEQE